MTDRRYDKGRDLFRALTTDDEHALSLLMDRYYYILLVRITRIVIKENLAKEIASDVFQSLWENRRKVAEMEYPLGWLYKVAYHRCITILKIERLSSTTLIDDADFIPDPNSVENDTEYKEIVQLLAKSIEQLAPRQKQVYKLKEKGLTREEIAAELGISTHTVKNTLTQALKEIRETFSKLINSIVI
jgi:RNA polymerase sigma factor (sigma-70 family)